MFRNKKILKAAKLLKQLSSIFPDDVSLLEMYANNQTQLGRYVTAEKLLLRMIGFKSKMGKILTKMGYLKIERKKYEEARIAFF